MHWKTILLSDKIQSTAQMTVLTKKNEKYKREKKGKIWNAPLKEKSWD
jgi:hypothetical protein